ncbi:related to BTB/POZ domain-containing protein [Rhynchosporium graminicola]|uniref:Related to BTB/POZ domain-containing protein n=1 Tax=Rhynchosporium graminicola TaxID=2792576 RepID=A0A1E1KHP4_9HELO|nr:related to BTB/POZ domain-containing protein [Rhynchosporium commune]
MTGVNGVNGLRGGKQTAQGGGYSRDDSSTATMSSEPGILRHEPAITAARKLNTDIPHILPHEKVFPIQIGTELFRLSGASISSDERSEAEKPRAPSYFSRFFECQLKQAEERGGDTSQIRTLYIDRDPATFRDISLHLQGYHVTPRDGSHFVKLFADAQFYNLPRLISQLYEENIFISIGGRDFQIPRELFSEPGNSPNYFSLGFAVFFSSPTEVFPGLNREGLLRPPSIIPPSVPNRSADTFAQLLHLLRGYPLHIRDEEHRAELLRDCRYFHLKGLEQKLLRHSISYNLCRKREEITLRLEDVRQSGISIVGDASATLPPESVHAPAFNPPQGLVGHVNYARPFVDDRAYELVLEIGDECTRLHLSSMRCEFFKDGKARISRLFEVIATKLKLPTSQPLGLLMKKGGASSQPASPGNTPLSEDRVRCVIDENSFIRLDGKEWHGQIPEQDNSSVSSTASSVVGGDDGYGEPMRKRRRTDGSVAGLSEEKDVWIVRRGQWRLRVQNSRSQKGGVECVLVAVNLDAFAFERGRNAQRGFLAG